MGLNPRQAHPWRMKPGAKWGIVAAIGVVAVALIAWILWPQPSVGQTESKQENGVTVTATLLSGDGLRFKVILDTHTVDLSDYDVVAKTRVIVDGVTWRAHGESRVTDNTGHHVEADLVFDGERHGEITLVLEDLGGIPERRLEFSA